MVFPPLGQPTNPASVEDPWGCAWHVEDTKECHMVDRGPVVIQVKIKVAAVTTSRHGGERGV